MEVLELSFRNTKTTPAYCWTEQNAIEDLETNKHNKQTQSHQLSSV